jgi:hypothetical protein
VLEKESRSFWNPGFFWEKAASIAYLAILAQERAIFDAKCLKPGRTGWGPEMWSRTGKKCLDWQKNREKVPGLAIFGVKPRF